VRDVSAVSCGEGGEQRAAPPLLPHTHFLHPSPRRTPALHEALPWFAGARLAGSLLAEAYNGLIPPAHSAGEQRGADQALPYGTAAHLFMKKVEKKWQRAVGAS